MSKIVIDRAIPYIRGVFEPYAEVEYLDGKTITASDVADADAIVIRTRTKCNQALLEESKVKHIATATIGFDHIDLNYCHTRKIEVSTAAGCNARAVLQWVSAVLAHLSKQDGWCPSSKKIGVVGVGHVGSLIVEYCSKWGFCVMPCDPPRQKAEGGEFYSLKQIAATCDIITFHTPLDATTRHMVDAELLTNIKPGAIIINSSRGEVVDTRALLDSGHKFVLDVWESEPNIASDVMVAAILATPHIAGYSEQGKARATEMVVQSIASSLDLPLRDWRCCEVKPSTPQPISWQEMIETIDKHVEIQTLSNTLKNDLTKFEALRDNYRYRQEYF